MKKLDDFANHLRHEVAVLRIVGPDEYRLDANKDGWGCESYG